MKELVCEFSLFDLHQRIFILDKAANNMKYIGITTLKRIPEVILKISDKEQIYNIHLFGNRVYAKKLKENILILNAEQYSENKINVEVN